ncbi:TonB-dependent receptor [uncultured Desulfobacter sp.]|uniref:TonB-dependent receptor n=1 Tax=uncultured Desulfobacter sp. TaxID=240139 RepID=UPI002AAC162D|nr:TonB-dependent receptor [uncultured Desulfobacter sp.]
MKKRRKTARFLAALILTSTVFMLTGPGYSDEARDINPGKTDVCLGETVVTASKQKDLEKDLPVSISVVDDQTMDDFNIRTTEEMTRFVPNLYFKTATSGNALVSRGISTIDTSLFSPMGFYVDDVASSLSYMLTMPLFDIEQVEVLKGPQSTLYGKNSSSGVVNMVLAPQGNDFRSKVMLEAGSYDTWSAGAMVGGAIRKDTLFYTLSLLETTSDGYMENTTFNSDKVSDDRTFAGRASLRFTPSPDLDVTLALDGTDRDMGIDDLRYADGASASDRYKVVSNQESRADQDSLNQSVHLKYRFDDMDLVSISSHQDFNRDHVMDSDRSASPLSVSRIVLDQESWAQEIRLSSDARGFFSSWLIGAYAATENLDNARQLDHVSAALANLRVTESDTDSLALFGQASKALTPRLTATAGLRLDHSSASGAQLYTSSAGTLLFSEDLSDTELLPMASLSWEFSEQATGYISYSTGWMAGGYDYYSATSQSGFTYDPEYTQSFEAGMKTAFFDNRVRANFSIFYTDIRDKQIREEVVGGGVGAWKITNAASAHTEGVELEVRALPTRHLELFGGLGYTRAEIDDWTGTLNGTAKDYSGCTLPWAPDLTANAGVSYTGDSGWYATAHLFLAGKQYFDAANTLEDNGYALVNLKTGYRFGRYDISLWCKNLFDEEYAQKKVKSNGYTLMEDGEPMTFGITLIWRF